MLERHVNFLFLATFLTYTYRDLFPLATYNLHPRDGKEGDVLWWKIGLVAIAAALPLAMSRQYKPVNSKVSLLHYYAGSMKFMGSASQAPFSNPNPEQTATPFSLMFFCFMDPVIFAASRVTHLAAERLPPLADYDAADHLRKKVQKVGACFRPLEPLVT